MKFPNIDAAQAAVEARAKIREKKKTPKMKVSGGSVKTLARIIGKKAE